MSTVFLSCFHRSIWVDVLSDTKKVNFSTNYNGAAIRPEDVIVLFLTKVIFKAVSEKWAKNVRSVLYFVGNEALGKYNISSIVSIDSLYDEYSIEIGYALSVKTVLKKKEELEYLL